VNLSNGALHADQEYTPLVPAQKPMEFGIIVTRLAIDRTFHPHPHDIATRIGTT
jgi:hypothetical protein